LTILCVRLASPLFDASAQTLSQPLFSALHRLDALYQAYLAGQWHAHWLRSIGADALVAATNAPEGFSFFALPFALFASCLTAFKLAVFAALLLGASGAYALARQLGRGRFGSTIGGLFIMMSPFIAITLYHDGQVRLLLATMVVPWLFLFYFRLSQQLRDVEPFFASACGFAFALAGLYCVDPVSTFWACVALLLFLLEDVLRGPKRCALLGALACALSVSVCLLLPVAIAWQPEPVSAEKWDSLLWAAPFQMAAAIVGLGLSLRLRYAAAGAVAWILLLVVCLPEASAVRAWFLFVPHVLTSPHVLSVLLSVCLVGVCFFVGVLRRICPPFAGGITVGMCVVAFAAIFPYLQLESLQETRTVAELASVQKGKLLSSQLVAPDDLRMVVRAPAQVIVYQLGQTGWNVSINGKRVVEPAFNEAGYLYIAVPAKGEKTLRVWHEHARAPKLLLGAIIAGCLLLAFLCDWSWWRSKRHHA
jgi:hypothetical protein